MNKIKEIYYLYMYKFFMYLSVHTSVASYQFRNKFIEYERKYKNMRKTKVK
jgi:hypothetical protein